MSVLRAANDPPICDYECHNMSNSSQPRKTLSIGCWKVAGAPCNLNGRTVNQYGPRRVLKAVSGLDVEWRGTWLKQ